jgi:hypothetical protein
MRILFRATSRFLSDVRADLVRPHSFALERVGFVAVKAAHGADHLVLLATAYHSVADVDYLEDATVGARIGPEALRKALEIALLQSVGMFHIHLHDHGGPPRFSPTDLREQRRFVPDFFNVRSSMPHGAIVLSHDGERGRCWLARDYSSDISEFQTVGTRNRIQAIDVIT